MRVRVLSFALLLGLLMPQSAQAWWDGAWANRMRVLAGADPAAAPAPLGRTRVLVRLHQGLFNFASAKEDGTDIRFVAADDRTPLRFHVEKYDGLIEQVGLFWVDVPDLALGGAGTAFTMYWGNRNAPPAGEARATYDSDTVLAWNFADDAGNPRDATGYGNHATSAARRDDGLVGAGQRFDGAATVRMAASPSLGWNAGGPVTWSFWFRADAAEAEAVLYQARDGASVLTLGLAAGAPYAELRTEAGTQRTEPGLALPPETWRHLALVATAERLALFVDAAPRGGIAAGLPAMSGAAALGGPLPAEPPAAEAPVPVPGFVGLIDVFRIAKAATTPAALQAALRGEGPRADLLRFDVAEEGSVFGTGHFGVIARNVTIDAWVVIGICGVMAPLTWWVIGAKSVFVNRMAGANARFRRAFRAGLAKAGGRGIAGVEGLGAEAGKRYAKSSLHRFYVVALAELEARGGVGRAGTLPAPSLAAIRAALDAQYTTETLRLGSAMVVLTIAIAGGPFIGLLGTVIGVMITFAAIAAAGDVNVNAIAPGIAAALLATVAGLAVAIPALFGYNYLVTRIRDVSADMRVFIDELVTRIGEGGTDFRPALAPTMAKAAE